MLKKIAFAAVLLQVAAYSALLTQTFLLTSTATQAASVQGEPVVAVTATECDKATWPDIPIRCLERVQARLQ
ncbi:hypothetical protein FJW08_03505 [Mesorhizobium sp. B3-2-1]|uniref:hypothetical protein n=1 Tax=Mesorhizobium sp. B3-2-1 TaxID=2589891 RepID=UPI0011263B2A|nr:hypothetical protein [Mesorhizobium sp. B3-2-1]TPI34653.1 hypothetical protein FJW08_03505 [Mesorhizobium sp. B3-2-1]